MSVEIKYKGNTIASASTDTTKTIKTGGKYCEADLEVINTQDGGITPTGKINITDTTETDVTNYATAQVVDADLIASNIKKDVNILGVIGSFEGGGISDVEEVTITSAITTSLTVRDFLRALIPTGKTRVSAMLKGKALSEFNDAQFLFATVVVNDGSKQLWLRYNNATSITSSDAMGGNALKLDAGDKIVVTFM